MPARFVASSIACLALAACGGTPDAEVAGAGTRPAAPPVVVGDTACPVTGPWRPCSVAVRLERAGLAPRLQPDTLADPAFGVPGQRYLLGDATLDVFVYASEEARVRATAALDSAAVVRTRSRLAPPPEQVSALAPGQPAGARQSHFVRTANIAAVLANVRERQAERVLLALTAGQPAR